MKYLLAVINKLTYVYGPDLLVGYDIACSFSRTVVHSTIGPRVKAMGLTGIVPSLHGHAHDRRCQVQWHPLYLSGARKEDFEGCKWCFSASNHPASGARLASAFHRRQAIEQFLSLG